MSIEYVMPKLAMAMNEGTVAEWLVSDGDQIQRGDQLLTVETEKTAYEVEAPDSGYFRILVEAGETRDCGTVLGVFYESLEDFNASSEATHSAGEAVPAPAPAPAPAAAAVSASSAQNVPPERSAAPTANESRASSENPAKAPLSKNTSRIIASPLAKRMAKDAGLDLQRVTGTGPGGRIVKRDVEAQLQSKTALSPLHITTEDSEVLATIPMAGMRKVIANRLMDSLQSTAQLSSFWESNLSRLLDVRQQLVAKEDELGTRISVNAMLIKAMIYGIRRVPIANSCVVDDQIHIYRDVHVGVAVSVPGSTEYDSGLVVPVLRHADKLGLVELDQAMKALIKKAKEGACTSDDFVGSTITFSTTAGLAPPGHRSTPVLNLPNAMLIGPSTPKDKPWNVDGEVKIQTVLPVSVTFDHRALDGDPAVRFMNAMHEAIENPNLLLL